MFKLRPMSECNGFHAYRTPMFAVCDANGKALAVFTSYQSARDILDDSYTIVSRWQTIPLAKHVSELPPLRAGCGLL